MNWPMLALLAIAVARATHLVADDEFPFGPVRTWGLKKSPDWLWALGCTFCVSLHAGLWAAGLAIWQDWITVPDDTAGAVVVFLVVAFALSQVAILLEGLVALLMGDPE